MWHAFNVIGRIVSSLDPDGKGQTFVLTDVSDAVLAVLKLARLDKVFTIRTALDA